MATVERFHIECCGCGAIWPEGKGYAACNTLWEDVPKDWTLGTLPTRLEGESAVDWYGRTWDYCPKCRPSSGPKEGA